MPKWRGATLTNIVGTGQTRADITLRMATMPLDWCSFGSFLREEAESPQSVSNLYHDPGLQDLAILCAPDAGNSLTIRVQQEMGCRFAQTCHTRSGHHGGLAGG